MNILVCVKQVPDTNEIKIDPETNTLVRDGVPSIVNTFDGYTPWRRPPASRTTTPTPRSWC